MLSLGAALCHFWPGWALLLLALATEVCWHEPRRKAGWLTQEGKPEARLRLGRVCYSAEAQDHAGHKAA